MAANTLIGTVVKVESIRQNAEMTQASRNTANTPWNMTGENTWTRTASSTMISRLITNRMAASETTIPRYLPSRYCTLLTGLESMLYIVRLSTSPGTWPTESTTASTTPKREVRLTEMSRRNDAWLPSSKVGSRGASATTTRPKRKTT